MSRPPRPYSGQSTTSPPSTGRGAMDYMPSEFADLVERQRALAASELKLVSTGQEGDFAGTLMELSALVAHVLGVYQDRYAGESFLGTAQSARSLVRHGRRLGYEPDPGLAATGYLLINVPDGLSGTVPQGFAVSSAPVGEKKAQDYETLEDVPVHHLHNELRPRQRMESYALDDPYRFEVHGGRLGLVPGDVIVIETDAQELSAHTVVKVVEAEDGATTLIHVEQPLPAWEVRQGFRMFARPATTTHLFGWDAPSLTYTDDDLRSGKYEEDPEKHEGRGYVVPNYDDAELYLSRELDKLEVNAPLIRLDGDAPMAFRLVAHTSKPVILRKTGATVVTTYVPGKDGQPAAVTELVPHTNELAATVTAIQARNYWGYMLYRAQQDIRASRWLFDFQLMVPLVHERPAQALVTQPLRLEGEIEGLEPGQLIALSSVDDIDEEGDVEIAEITSVGVTGTLRAEVIGRRGLLAEAGAVASGDSLIGFRIVEPSTGGREWKLGELRLQGNVARISHGKTSEEVLGDSDGVTPFLRFPLKNSPLTHLPGPNGAVPALEVRVGGVLWTRVEDFYESDPYDRHYLLQRDEAGTTFVVFGDGSHGAIPPAGRKHLSARYRVGLGRIGNAEPGLVDRVKKAHPLVRRAHNPIAISGGAEPAGAEDVRTQATRYIRTFGRAVSVQDHADLALLYPGVSRAVAHRTMVGGDAETQVGGRLGIRVTVAGASGEQPGALGDLLKFLDARRDPIVPLEVVGPSTRDVVVKVYVEYDRAYLPEAVQAAIREAFYGQRDGAPGLFTFEGRELGQPAHLSEVYAAITAVPGVAFAQVTTFDVNTAPNATPRVVDIIRAEPGEWLRLLPQHFGFSLPAEEAP